jgi:hypothetical protein
MVCISCIFGNAFMPLILGALSLVWAFVTSLFKQNPTPPKSLKTSEETSPSSAPEVPCAPQRDPAMAAPVEPAALGAQSISSS